MSYLLKEIESTKWYEDGKIYGIPVNKIGTIGIRVNNQSIESIDYYDYVYVKDSSIEDLIAAIMDYKKNVCPYDVGQLLIAHKVLDWAIEQEDRVHNNIHNMTILGLIDDVIINEIVRQVHIKRLEDYTIEELEKELELRKSK